MFSGIDDLLHHCLFCTLSTILFCHKVPGYLLVGPTQSCFLFLCGLITSIPVSAGNCSVASVPIRTVTLFFNHPSFQLGSQLVDNCYTPPSTRRHQTTANSTKTTRNDTKNVTERKIAPVADQQRGHLGPGPQAPELQGPPNYLK